MIRYATPGDAETLADVHVATWQTAYAGIFPDEYLATLDQESRARWWRQFIQRGAEVHVAVEGRVIGFCHADSSDEKGWGEIYAIYVHPDHWDEGHGFQLLSAGESTLRDRGHDRALLWVLESNERGRRFYERNGWAPGKPIRVEEIGGVQVTELRYEKDLTTVSSPRRDHQERSL